MLSGRNGVTLQASGRRDNPFETMGQGDCACWCGAFHDQAFSSVAVM